MTELLILMCFVPFTLLSLFSVKKTYLFLTWSSVVIAAACLGLFVFVKKDDPMTWVPAASFMTLVLLRGIYSKDFRVLPLLGCLFLGQALLSKDTGVILILLAFSDVFFCADIFSSSEINEKSKAIQGIYQAALSLVPAALGVLLHLQGQAFIAAAACTIVFRLFSWPLNHWVYDVHKETRIFLIYAGSISAFALWHAQDLSNPSFWPLIWLSLALIFSMGAKYSEVYTALCLGVFSVSPTLGVLAVCFWPLLVNQGLGVFVIAAISMLSGAVIADQASKGLSVEGGFALAVFAALAIARVFVGTPWQRFRWYYEAISLVLALVLSGVLLYITPLPIPTLENSSAIFAGTFVVMFIVGLIVSRKRTVLFAARRNIPASFFSRDIISFEFLEDKPGEPAQIKTRPFQLAFFRAIETEAYVIALMGLLGVALLWGAK